VPIGISYEEKSYLKWNWNVKSVGVKLITKITQCTGHSQWNVCSRVKKKEKKQFIQYSGKKGEKRVDTS
jgi:hypothetical protein